MQYAARLHFRDELRRARQQVLLNAEDHISVVQVLESMGRLLAGYGAGLGKFQSTLVDLASPSGLCDQLPRRWQGYHIPFERLLSSIREARNVAVHEGAVARRLAVHSIECALVLEDALQSDMVTVADFMVRSPVTAERWHPLSFVRQAMLAGSYSFLPVNSMSGWRLISDASLVGALRSSAGRKERDRRLSLTLQEALDESLLELQEPICAHPTDPVAALAAMALAAPVLVLAPESQNLIGILAAFDLL
jgi:hypothetical protein